MSGQRLPPERELIFDDYMDHGVKLGVWQPNLPATMVHGHQLDALAFIGLQPIGGGL